MVGFDSLFFARIDYQDRAKRKNEKSLEVIWRGSKSFGSSAQIFAGAFPENYEPPSDFYFEVNDDSHDSPIVQDNINLFDYNVPQRINEFVAAAVKQANITRTNHIMWTMAMKLQGIQFSHPHKPCQSQNHIVPPCSHNGCQNILVQDTVNSLICMLNRDISQTERSDSEDVSGLVEEWPSKKDIGHMFEFIACYVACERANVSKSVLSQILE
ncbi:hypothetical protein ACB092_03G055800 [Castanea dentata]